MKVPPPHPVPPRPGPPPGRCPAATARDRGREGRHPPQGPQGQSIPANGTRRAARDPGRGTRNGAQGPRGPVRPDRVRGPGIYPRVSLTAAAGAQSAGGRVGAGLCVTQI